MSHKPRHQAQSRHRKASSHQGWGILTVRLSSLTEGQASRWPKKQVHSCTRCRGCKELQRGWLSSGCTETAQHAGLSGAQGTVSSPRAETTAEVMGCDVQGPVIRNDDRVWTCFSWGAAFRTQATSQKACCRIQR